MKTLLALFAAAALAVSPVTMANPLQGGQTAENLTAEQVTALEKYTGIQGMTVAQIGAALAALTVAGLVLTEDESGAITVAPITTTTTGTN